MHICICLLHIATHPPGMETLLVHSSCYCSHRDQPLAGSAEARAAAVKAGAMEVVLQLLQDNINSRLAFDAADILAALVTNGADSFRQNPKSQMLGQLVSVTKQLLHICDALTDDAPLGCHRHSLDGVATNVDLSGISSERSGHSELESIKEDSVKALQLPAAPFSQALSETPSRAFARSASLKLQPGLPPIVTRADGQHSEAAMPKTPYLPSPEPTPPTDADTASTANRGGAASTSHLGRTSKDISWLSSSQPSSSIPATVSSSSRSLSCSQSGGSTWMRGLLKRIGSIRSQSSANTTGPGSVPDLRRSASFQQSQLKASVLSPFASFSERPISPPASHTPTAIHMPTPTATLNWVPRKPSCPRHPSHPILQAVVAAMTKCIGGHPSYQAQAQQLGCAALALDVLSLAGRVGVKGGLAAPAADLVKDLAEGNGQCQQTLGQAGAVGQLLAILKVCCRS